MKNKGIAIVVTLCAFVLALGLAACSGGGSSSGSAASGYVDAHGNLTIKALVDLDGAKLTKAAQDAGYEWNGNGCLWKKTGSSVSPSRGLSQEDYNASSGLDAFNFSADEVAAFAAGGAGTPVMWTISNSKAGYSSAEEIISDQQLDIVEQCAIDNAAYGTETWALVRSSAGERFLLEIRYDADKKSGDMLLYTADYVATEANGIASAFLFVPDGLYDAHTIDDAWTALKAAAQA